MKKLLLILLCLPLLFSCGGGKKSKEYRISSVTIEPNILTVFKEDEIVTNEHLTYLKFDMSLINGVVYKVNLTNDTLIETYYTDGERYRVKTYFEGTKQLHFDTYMKNNMLEGKYKMYYKNGQLAVSATFIIPNLPFAKKESVLHNDYREWYENGNEKTITNWVYGKLDGQFIEFYKNGQIAEIGMFINDKLDGVYQIFYKNGELKKKTGFKEGKEVYSHCWDEKGNEFECK